MSKTPFAAQQDLVQKEAEKRAEKIQAVGEKMLELAVTEGLTVNDLQVILNTLTQQLSTVFLSRVCSEFIDKKTE